MEPSPFIHSINLLTVNASYAPRVWTRFDLLALLHNLRNVKSLSICITDSRNGGDVEGDHVIFFEKLGHAIGINKQLESILISMPATLEYDELGDAVDAFFDGLCQTCPLLLRKIEMGPCVTRIFDARLDHFFALQAALKRCLVGLPVVVFEKCLNYLRTSL